MKSIQPGILKSISFINKIKWLIDNWHKPVYVNIFSLVQFLVAIVTEAQEIFRGK
jgi:hypothetical protein